LDWMAFNAEFIKQNLRFSTLLKAFLCGVALFLIPAEAPVRKHEMVVLYTSRDPILPDLPKSCCLWVPLENFQNSHDRARIVIVAGHGLPPYYAGFEKKIIAQAVRTYQPELIVMNSCYGASSDIFQAFTDQGLFSRVVAAPFPIYQPGFIFEPAFLAQERSLEEKIMAIRTDPSYPLVRWRLNAERLAELQAQVDQLPSEALKKRLRRVQPALVRMPFPSFQENKSEILVPVPVSRF